MSSNKIFLNLKAPAGVLENNPIALSNKTR